MSDRDDDDARAERDIWTAPANPREAAQGYRTLVSIVSRAHYLLARRNGAAHRALGVAAVALTSGVAGFAFAQPGRTMTYILGAISTIAAAVAAVQTVLNLAEIARRHQEAGIEYAALRRRFDLMLLGESDDNLADLYNKLDDLARKSPTIPDPYFNRAKKEILEEQHSQNRSAP